MSWKRYLELAAEAFLILVMCWAIYKAQFWPTETRLFPEVVGSLVLILTSIAFIMDLLRMRRLRARTESDIELDLSAEPDLTDSSFATRAGAEFAWLVGYGVVVWLVGFYPATFVYLLLYFWQRAKFSLLISLLGTIIATGAVIGIFYYLLQVTPYNGLLGNWLFS